MEHRKEPFAITLDSPEATMALGAGLARAMGPGDVLALSGDLGAGKTTLAQGFFSELGHPDEVISPTFALMAEYRGERPGLHVDAYRLAGAGDADQLGLDEYIDAGWMLVVEWAEIICDALPEDLIQVTLLHVGDARKAVIGGTGPRGRGIAERVTGLGDS